MDIVGIICEYNPFHNGHIYHLKKVKELFPNSLVILVMSGNFSQRGLPSIINKWDKTEIALKYGIDLVIELPFAFASQGADIFAKGSISLLNHLGAKYLVFGSESNDSDELMELAKLTINNKEYDERVKYYLSLGKYNYPTSLNLALKDISKKELSKPNDLLGFSYMKEIVRQKANITPITIKRTNEYHDIKFNDEISSATSIRKAFLDKIEWKNQVPKETVSKMKNSKFLLENYFPYLKYKIMSSDDLSIYQTVDEGIENRLKKVIYDSTSFEDLIDKLKTKRYTFSKISRMLIHILCNFTKEKAKAFSEIEYIRVLGYSSNGKNYLSKIKKDISIPIVTTFSKCKSPMLQYEKIVTSVYCSILNEDKKNELIKLEYSCKPKEKK